MRSGDAAITCPALTSADASNATFAESPVAATVTGTCLPGYAGTATRACTGTDSQPGTWGPPLSSCTRTRRRARETAWYFER
jgi:hypothetical protein